MKRGRFFGNLSPQGTGGGERVCWWSRMHFSEGTCLLCVSSALSTSSSVRSNGSFPPNPPLGALQPVESHLTFFVLVKTMPP